MASRVGPGLLALLLSTTPALAGVDEELSRAGQSLESGDLEAAIRGFRAASRAVDGPCFRCELGLATALSRSGSHRKAEDHARSAIALATDEGERARAYNQLGISLFANGAADEGRLEGAADAFGVVIELSHGAANMARFNRAGALLELGRDDEGVALLREFLAHEPAGPAAERARSLIDDPRRARMPLVPRLDLATLDGGVLTNQDLEGKVVLIDFWATWCAPCHRALPGLRRLDKRLDDEPFVLLGISWDRDEETVRRFLADHEIDWPQVLDPDGRTGRDLFDVRSLPTYVLVGHDGEILYRAAGWSDAVDRVVGAEISRAIRRAKRAARNRRDGQ